MIGAVRVLAALGLAALGASASGGCRSTAGDQASSDAATSAPPPHRAPVDRLADGELLEGDARAFDLALPRGARVEGAFAKVVFAQGPFALHALVEYFRPRLVGGDLHEGPDDARFEHAQAANKPGRRLTIHLAALRQGTRIEVRDETLAPPPDLPDEAARWRHVGLTPDGRLADPTHLN